MKGSIGYAKHVNRYYVAWYHAPEKKPSRFISTKGNILKQENSQKKLLGINAGRYGKWCIPP